MRKIVKGHCASFIAALVVAGAALGAFAEGKVFWWKGPAWGSFSDPANWDVGEVGEGNPDNLIPGTEDAFAHTAVAKIDLGGNTYTVKRRAKNFTGKVDDNNESLASTLHLTNGTLRVTEHHGPKLNIEVWNGATYDFVGNSYRDAYNISSVATENIHSGGKIAVGSTSTFYLFGLKFTIDEGGTFLFNPKTFTSHPSTSKVLTFSNYGTLDAPRGIYLSSPGWGTAANTVPQFTQYSGVTKLGGNVGRQNSASAKQLGFTLSGGTVEVTNSAAFVNMSANPPSVSANASVTFDVKVDSQFDIAGLVIGEGASITKTGAGDLKMADAMPSSLFVKEGRVVFAVALTIAGLSFETNTQVRVDVESVRIDDCESFTNATFSVGESLFQIGSTVLLSSDADILAHAKEGLDAQLQAAGVQAEGRIENGALVVRSAYPYTFNAAVSSDLTDPTAWRSGSVPSAETPVRISGAGTVNFTSESRKFVSITVEEGATLSVSGGTAESPVDMPVVELDYEARLLLSEGAVVQITNTFTCVGNADTLPVFEIATNATAIVQTPVPLNIWSPFDLYSYAGNDYGFRVKNVSLKWYGDIQTYYADTRDVSVYSRLLLGWAEAGETSYIAIDCRGGRYIAAGEANSAARCRTPLVVAVPQSGGTVVPVGTLYFRDYSCKQRTSSASNPEIYVPGLFIGRWNEYNGNTAVAGNPTSVAFDVLFEGTIDCYLMGIFRLGGAAHVTLRGPGVQWKYTCKVYNDEGILRTLVLTDASSISLEDGALLDICSSDSAKSSSAPYAYRGLRTRGTADGQTVFSADSSRMSLLHWYGTGKSVASINDSLLEIGYLRSDNTRNNVTGVLDGFKYATISNAFTIAAADVDRIRSDKDYATKGYENWNRSVHIGPPLTGPGSLVVSNELSGAHAVYSMTVTVTNGANTATGRAFAAQTAGGAPTALVFADGANWAGEVVADGNVTLTNLVSEGSAAEVSFAALRIDGAMPLRVWKTGGEIVANDRIDLASAPTGKGELSFVAMDEEVAVGDRIPVGLYPAELPVPASTPHVHFETEPSETEGFVTLVATVNRPGMLITIH